MAKRKHATSRHVAGISFNPEELRELDLLARALSPNGLHIPRSVVIKYAIRKALEEFK